MKKYILIITLVFTCTLTFPGCKKKEKPVDSTVSSITTAQETATEDTTAAETTTTVQKETASKTNPPKSSDESYVSNKLTIKYPKLTNLANPANEAIINELIKNNALSIIDAYKLDPTKDSLNLTYKLLSLDRNRATILYSGDYTMNYAAYPTAVYFTNTINLNTAKNIRLKDYIDATSLGQVIVNSDNYKIITDDSNLEKEIKEYLSNMELSTLESLFNDADFGGTNPFPESFSYEEKGAVIFTIPVSHVLGDYTRISYTPESK